jgi:hypothetical protein
MLKIPFWSLFNSREKNSSYEGWYADIDTADQLPNTGAWEIDSQTDSHTSVQL